MNNISKSKVKFIHPFNIWCGNDQRWKTYISDSTKPKGRKMIVRLTEDALYQFLYNYYDCDNIETSNTDITVELLYPEWLEYKKLHTTADTYITRLNSDWKSFYEGTSIIQTPICKLNKLTLDIWAHKLIKEHHMTRKKYTNMQTIMRQVLAYANDLGLISNNPMNSVKIEKGMFVKSQKKPNTTQVFSPSEKAEIIELAWADFRNSVKFYELSPLALIFQFYTGLRLGELCCVRYEDIEEDDYIHIQRMIRRESKEVVPHTKTDCGDRKVYLTPAAKHIIATARERQQTLHVDSNGYIFSINGLPLTERSIADLLRKYSKKLGIVHKSSHKVRKTYGSNLLNNGVSIDTTRLMLGHSDERTTLAYYCYDTNEDAENRKLFEKALQ